jgi:hypothetical protein
MNQGVSREADPNKWQWNDEFIAELYTPHLYGMLRMQKSGRAQVEEH